MAGPALARFNDWLWEAHGEPGLHMGVGLNAGTVMSGNMGSEQHMEYTCIGDTTNTAARLESLTKGSGWSIYVAESVRTRLVRDDAADLVQIPEMEIRGRSGRLIVWATGQTGGATPAEDLVESTI